jgi:hypothetical protein
MAVDVLTAIVIDRPVREVAEYPGCRRPRRRADPWNG